LPIAGNFFQSPEGQIYTSASKAWAEGALRISTGSAGPASEIDRLVATYFAQPGDTPVTIEFKRSMREMYSRAIRKSLGETGVSGELVLPLDFAEMLGGVPKAPVSRDEALSILSGGK
jgi:hypothetical protein